MPKLSIRPTERGGKTEVLVRGAWTFASLAAHQSELERTLHTVYATGRTDLAWNPGAWPSTPCA